MVIIIINNNNNQSKLLQIIQTVSLLQLNKQNILVNRCLSDLFMSECKIILFFFHKTYNTRCKAINNYDNRLIIMNSNYR